LDGLPQRQGHTLLPVHTAELLDTEARQRRAGQGVLALQRLEAGRADVPAILNLF